MNDTQTAQHTGPSQAEIHVGVILAALELSGAKINKDAKQFLEAAPDLLAACKAALAYLENNRPKGNIRDNFSAFNAHENSAVKPLRAAIAKATGQA